MAKAKKELQKQRVALDSRKLTREASAALSELTNLLFSGYEVMTIDTVLERFNLLKAECGGDAKVSLKTDDYFGNEANIIWYRDETDDEFKKRLARNVAISEGQRKKRAADRVKKIENEKADLERLRKKYPNG